MSPAVARVKVIVMVLPLAAVEVTLAVPSATAALTLPGKVGAGQPAGTTIVTIELAAKVAFGLRKSKRKLLPLLPDTAKAGFTCMLPAPFASVNVAEAVLDREAVWAELPTTVRGIVSARLDGLAPTERAVLMDAAVVGRVFWRGALMRLGPEREGEGVGDGVGDGVGVGLGATSGLPVVKL